MIWVDGHDQALIRGTGTEDEFNWSYSLKENQFPVSGCLYRTRRRAEEPQDKKQPHALYRWRLGDFVPFASDIKVTYERLGQTNDMLPRFPGSPVNVSHHRGDDYRSVAFWYEMP